MERFITRESMYSISMLGAMEAVKFGSTFIDDLYHFPESTARVAEELGLRGIIAQKIYDPDLQNLHNNDYSSVPGQAAQKLQANYRKTFRPIDLCPTPPIPSPRPKSQTAKSSVQPRAPPGDPTTGKPADPVVPLRPAAQQTHRTRSRNVSGGRK